MTYDGMTNERINKFFGSTVELDEKDIALFHEKRLEVLNDLVQPLEAEHEALEEEIKAFLIEKGNKLLTLKQLIKVLYKEYGASEETMKELRGQLEAGKESA